MGGQSRWRGLRVRQAAAGGLTWGRCCSLHRLPSGFSSSPSIRWSRPCATASTTQSASKFIGLNNYKAIFSTASILITFRNNVIWFIVFPFLVTLLGLVFAVLTERIRWSTAFKTIVFMPIVFSATASGLVWRSILDLDPHVGMVNATIADRQRLVQPAGSLPGSAASGQTVADLAATGLRAAPGGALQSRAAVGAGGTALLGFVGISPQP